MDAPKHPTPPHSHPFNPGIAAYMRSRTCSGGKAHDSEPGGPQFHSRHKASEKNLHVLFNKALHLRVVLDNDHLLSLDYDTWMLKDLITAP